jgi:hypothetical protein
MSIKGIIGIPVLSQKCVFSIDMRFLGKIAKVKR